MNEEFSLGVKSGLMNEFIIHPILINLSNADRKKIKGAKKRIKRIKISMNQTKG